MTLHECRVDRLFPYHMIRCWVRTRPPAVWALGPLFKPAFWLNPQTPKRCLMDLWSAHLVLIHLHRHRHQPSLLQLHPDFKVSILSFLSVVLFLWWAAFCPFSVKQRATFQLFLFECTCRESRPFICPTGCLNYCLTWVVVEQFLGPLFWDSWSLLSFCSTGPASPAWSFREPSDLSGLDQDAPLGLLQDAPWALSRNPQIPDYS